MPLWQPLDAVFADKLSPLAGSELRSGDTAKRNLRVLADEMRTAGALDVCGADDEHAIVTGGHDKREVNERSLMPYVIAFTEQ